MGSTRKPGKRSTKTASGLPHDSGGTGENEPPPEDAPRPPKKARARKARAAEPTQRTLLPEPVVAADVERAAIEPAVNAPADEAATDEVKPQPEVAGPETDLLLQPAPWDEAEETDASSHIRRPEAEEELDETQISTRRGVTDSPQFPAGGEKPPCIIVISHPDPAMLGRRYDLLPGDPLIIGRSSEVGISLAGLPVVSRRHARVFRANGDVMIEDLGSRNGTFLRGEKLQQAAKLSHGDQFNIEAVHFRFITGGNVEQAFHEAIYGLVMHDDLTRIYNRRKYEKEVERDFARATRHQRSLSLVVFDVDHFKEINDKYGHLCGDVVLQQVSSLATQYLRRDVLFARFGGDEFVILCPEVALTGARILAERLRAVIEAHPFRFDETTMRVTCSFGVAELTPEIHSPAELYAVADARLYAAKSGGRNQTV